MKKPKIKKAAKVASKTSVTLDRMAVELNHLRNATDRLKTENDAMKITMASKFEVVTQVADMFTVLRDVFNTASSALAAAGSYTKREIEAMSAEEYRKKILLPLNMGQRVYSH